MGEFMFTSHVKVGENRFRERYGLDFEEFQVGQVFKHRPGVTLSQQDNAEEALDTLNQAMLHFDADYAAKTEWKRNLGVSTLTLQRVIGMTSKTFGKRIRIEGFSEIKMTHPVFGGDTLYAETEIKDKQDVPGDPSAGRLRVVTSGLTPDGTVVCSIEYDILVYKRDAVPFEKGNY